MNPSNTPDRPEDIDLGWLFATPQIDTDEAGRHRDREGREYVAVERAGELDFVPACGPFDRAPLVDVESARALLAEAVAGLSLKEYDRRILAWVGTWNGPTAVVLAGLLTRARTVTR